ncbi:hypothetical protein YC2023_096868 [Brassica napus]
MGVSVLHRGMVLLLVISVVVLLQTDKVSSLRWERDMRLQLLSVHPLRVLEESSSSKEGNIDTNPDLAPSPSVIVSYKASKGLAKVCNLSRAISRQGDMHHPEPKIRTNIEP